MATTVSPHGSCTPDTNGRCPECGTEWGLTVSFMEQLPGWQRKAVEMGMEAAETGEELQIVRPHEY